jgi:hypothetical protein
MKTITESKIAIRKSVEKVNNTKAKSKIKPTEDLGRKGNLKNKKKGKKK